MQASIRVVMIDMTEKVKFTIVDIKINKVLLTCSRQALYTAQAGK